MDSREAHWRAKLLSLVEGKTSNTFERSIVRTFSARSLAQRISLIGFDKSERVDQLLERMDFPYFEKKTSEYAVAPYVPSDALTDPFTSKDKIFAEIAERNGFLDIWESYKSFGEDWLDESIENIGDIDVLFGSNGDEETNVAGEWEPLDVEYDTPSATRAIEAISDALEAISSDNGYAATYPAERDNVVQSLKKSLELFEIRAVYTKIYFQHSVWIPLKQASLRLGRSVAGRVVEGALEAIKEWVKSVMGGFLS